MHVSTKDTDDKGVHILTNVLEGDGAFAIASEKAKLSATVISVQRTESGGVKVQTALTISEPAPEKSAAQEAELSPEDQARAYFEEKGFSPEDAKKQADKFGAPRVLAIRDKERAYAQAEKDMQLDAELEAAVAKPPKKDDKPADSSNPHNSVN